MRAKLMILSAVIVGSVSGMFATGCQTYDFEPVEPLAISQTTVETRIEARNLKPNMMMLVDTSGSMSDPADPKLAACKNTQGEVCGIDFPCDINRCPTRWSELRGAMTEFLTTSGSVARIGLATYPSDPVCRATMSVRIPLPDTEVEAELQTKAVEVKDSILAIKNYGEGLPNPEGGTPTAQSLEYLLANVPQLKDATRRNFILLLTDGLPNCNAAFSETSCFCTTGDCSSASDRTGCLDRANSRKAVEALSAQNIQTIVIAFGSAFDPSTDLGKEGAKTLNDMAEAGGFARIDKPCTDPSPTSTECGVGGICVGLTATTPGTCNKFYRAANRTDLTTALKQISERVQTQDPCLISLNTAGLNPALVAVYFTYRGTTTRLVTGQDTWSLATGEGVRLAGTWCETIKTSTTADPVNIEVRAVQAR